MITQVYLVLPGHYRASEAPKMSKRGTRGNTTFKIHQKLEIASGLERGDSQGEIMASHKIRSSTVYNIRKCKNGL
jgi:hypothetical protein